MSKNFIGWGDLFDSHFHLPLQEKSRYIFFFFVFVSRSFKSVKKAQGNRYSLTQETEEIN